ncbi:tetratricopeptide repeat protein, partial [bacterium]|nr:tetratricopeptide repeat protein [bacterium]
KMYHEMNEAFIKSLEFSNKYASQIEKQRLEHWTNFINSGVIALRQNRVNEAIEQFQIAIELVPDRTVPYKNLAYAYVQNKNDSLAIETYLKVLEIDSTDLETKGYLGVLYLRKQDYEKAITYLEEVVTKSDPTSTVYSQAVSNLAICYDIKGQSDKAIEIYKKALEISPNDKDLLFNMARLHAQQKNYEQAIEYFQRVLEQAPDDVDAIVDIGYCYNQLEKFTEAIPYLEKAVELDPNNTSAWTNLGISYIRTEQGEKGNAAFKKVEELRNIP